MTPAANLNYLFCEAPLLDRFTRARAAGFDTIEMLAPYVEDASVLNDTIQEQGLSVCLINTPMDQEDRRYLGTAALPGEAARFQDEIGRAVTYSKALDARFIHVVAGIASGPEARETFLKNIDWAARTWPDQDFTLEPINSLDIPGFFLSDFGLTADILDTLSLPNVHFQFDFYHAEKITGDALGTWRRFGARAAHVQVASAPDRNEPDGLSPDYAQIWPVLREDGYAGAVSGEYRPRGRTEAGLGWMELVRAV